MFSFLSGPLLNPSREPDRHALHPLDASPPARIRSGVALLRGEVPPSTSRLYSFLLDPLGHPANVPGIAGCYLSHLRLLARILSEGHEAAVILEDDAHLATGFATRLRGIMGHLPEDWDVLYLQTCDQAAAHRRWHTWGIRAGPGVRHVRTATCTVGYVARYTMAAKVLQHTAFRGVKPVDMVRWNRILKGKGERGKEGARARAAFPFSHPFRLFSTGFLWA